MSRFNVTGLHCNGCVARVTKAVKEIAPDAVVAIDLPSGIMNLENAEADPSEIIAKIESCGYGASPA